jgi:hypothetical protein
MARDEQLKGFGRAALLRELVFLFDRNIRIPGGWHRPLWRHRLILADINGCGLHETWLGRPQRGSEPHANIGRFRCLGHELVTIGAMVAGVWGKLKAAIIKLANLN